MSDTPISVRNLNHWFGRGEARKQAIFDFSLDIAPGSLTVMVGPSGSGKTTVLTLMGCLRQVEDGSVRLLGQELQGADEPMLEALRRLSRMLEKLLQLSRAEAGVGSSSTPVDLVPLVKLLVETFQRSHPSAMIVLRPEPEFLSLVRDIDPDAFAIAFNNLLENATGHGDADQPVTIAVCADGRITVTNAVSAPLDPDLDVYRARFRRGRTSKPGSGLGLAIVEKLVAQMGGSMTLRSVVLPEGRTGFECELSLPPPKQ